MDFVCMPNLAYCTTRTLPLRLRVLNKTHVTAIQRILKL